ncbi:hypothetical protein J6590_106512, partial [Homalodisca vitripennis]
ILFCRDGEGCDENGVGDEDGGGGGGNLKLFNRDESVDMFLVFEVGCNSHVTEDCKGKGVCSSCCVGNIFCVTTE